MLDSIFFISYNTLVMLEKKLTYIKLFDEYRLLLTEKQQQIFALHFLEDLSFTEIAINLAISKQAVNDSLKKSSDQLEQLEQKLRLVEKQERRDTLIDRLLELSTAADIRQTLVELKEIA
ncbi:MAG: sigma factor-like helix-turn-helix DNA-binding protein [Bacillota bacterium]